MLDLRATADAGAIMSLPWNQDSPSLSPATTRRRAAVALALQSAASPPPAPAEHSDASRKPSQRHHRHSSSSSSSRSRSASRSRHHRLAPALDRTRGRAAAFLTKARGAVRVHGFTVASSCSTRSFTLTLLDGRRDFDYANHIGHTCARRIQRVDGVPLYNPTGPYQHDRRDLMEKEIDRIALAGTKSPQEAWAIVSSMFLAGTAYAVKGINRTHATKRYCYTREQHGLSNDQVGSVTRKVVSHAEQLRQQTYKRREAPDADCVQAAAGSARQ